MTSRINSILIKLHNIGLGLCKHQSSLEPTAFLGLKQSLQVEEVGLLVGHDAGVLLQLLLLFTCDDDDDDNDNNYNNIDDSNRNREIVLVVIRNADLEREELKDGDTHVIAW